MSNAPLALITGAGRGIGRAVAEALAPGHTVILAGRDRETLERARAELQAPHGAHVLVVDLGDPAARAAFLAEVTGLEGQLGRRVQVLINNAGAAHSAPLARTGDDVWTRLLELNCTAPFVLTRALVPGMIAAGWGRVVNVASTAAIKGYAYTAAYSASKAGLLGWTRALAVELAAKDVTVNAVCPGFTDTDIVADAARNIQATTGRSEDDARKALARFSPQGRLRSPAEVADLIAWLARPGAGGVTGQALAIDGGETA
ncbi:SDR family NAD(P)-dependent oxidoreductase [Nannocystis sp. SCPEA4]|uniref:SDR family NAD(P)-dependent oxidoreductase n=1 Tax=Nannocystis sp. SCPEA4 TaxID=2996787 RepID=UPI00226D9C0E|nr:SDR family NAD(P)-dependent oxidoreductase [Nannocystis sp. SCPEA4]MCY1053982.1 SDR family NAD(P)-dependent oxidoreductase [Nannocystis sp. SCPEA4]